MEEDLIRRIERRAGMPGLVEVLADRLSPTDLQSLLLSVYRRRAASLHPARVLDRYANDRFTQPSGADPRALAAWHANAFAILDSLGYAGVELSPVSPLGTVAALTTMDQNRVVSTCRNTEVAADATNSLALECALRRRAGPDAPVRLYASHRLLRAQRYPDPRMRPHFQLLALTTAVRDEGSFRFETRALLDQLDALLRLVSGVRVSLTDLSGGTRLPALQDAVVAPLRARYPHVEIGFDPDRTAGRGYYVDACFHLYRGDLQLADGGFTTWTRQLLGNAKERLLVGGMGVERLLAG